MPIKAVESQRLYRRIAEEIARLIKRGEYKPGARLPPERDLATMLKCEPAVGARSVDSAGGRGLRGCPRRLGCLRVAPAVRTRGKALRLAADSGPFELITARRLLEAECAALAAKNASPAQIRRMRCGAGRDDS